MKPLLDKVDAIDQAVTDLEKLVHAMDDYTIKLGASIVISVLASVVLH